MTVLWFQVLILMRVNQSSLMKVVFDDQQGKLVTTIKLLSFGNPLYNEYNLFFIFNSSINYS